MAFAAITGGSALGSTGADQTQTVLNTYSEGYSLGTLMLAYFSVDNNQTTDGDESAISNVTDGAGNVFTKAKAFTNGQGAAQAGATVELWYSVLTNAVVFGNAIPRGSFSNSTSRDRSVAGYKGFSFGSGNTIAIEGTSGTLANDGAAVGSLNVTTANIECLRVRVIASETNSATALTPTAGGWAALPSDQTASGGATSNMAIRGEYLISTATSAASAPTYASADHASVYVAFKEVAPSFNTQQRNQAFVRQAINRASRW